MRLKFKNQDEKQEWIEVFVGGACGLIAIIAAIVEYCLGENGALAGLFKDVFGTAVVVVLLLVAAMPKRKPKNLVGLLEQEVEDWGLSNAPLIFKAEGYQTAKNTPDKTQCFLLLQDPKEDYIPLVGKKLNKESPNWLEYAQYGGVIKTTGKFLDMPSYADMVNKDFEIELILSQKHFKEMPEINSIIGDLESAINAHCDKRVRADKKVSTREIKLKCTRIQTKEDIYNLIDALDFIVSLVKVVA